MNNLPPILQLSQILKEGNKYLGLNQENLVITTPTKEKRLCTVLPAITEIINKDKQNKKNITSFNINPIKKNIDEIYERYQTSVNTNWRFFLKTIAKITPNFLKPYLPACFSNRMAEAEKETREAYEAFCKAIKEYQEEVSPSKKTNTNLSKETQTTHTNTTPTNPSNKTSTNLSANSKSSDKKKTQNPFSAFPQNSISPKSNIQNKPQKINNSTKNQKKNPFKIPDSLSPTEALQAYKGPLHFAFVFQIPLARKGCKSIFSPSQKVLDPITIAFWLHQNDFEKLKDETSVRTLLFEELEIDDHSLIAFVKKFPNVANIHLAYCPKLTDEGLNLLLKEFSGKIHRLDLTGCKQITDKAFDFTEENISLPQELTLSGTQVSENCRQKLKEKCSVFWEEIAINDEQLSVIDVNALSTAKIVENAEPSPEVAYQFAAQSLFSKQDISLAPPFNLNDFTLIFQQNPQSEPLTIETSAAYLRSHSLFFLRAMRPGGILRREKAHKIINQWATKEVVKAIKKLLAGKKDWAKGLSIEAVTSVALIIRSENLSLHTKKYQCILADLRKQFNLMDKQFNLDLADRLLKSADLLNDQEAKKEYEKKLLVFLKPYNEKVSLHCDTSNNVQTVIAKLEILAKNHKLSTLSQKVAGTQQLIKEKEKLDEEIIKENPFSQEEIPSQLQELLEDPSQLQKFFNENWYNEEASLEDILNQNQKIPPNMVQVGRYLLKKEEYEKFVNDYNSQRASAFFSTLSVEEQEKIIEVNFSIKKSNN